MVGWFLRAVSGRVVPHRHDEEFSLTHLWIERQAPANRRKGGEGHLPQMKLRCGVANRHGRCGEPRTRTNDQWQRRASRVSVQTIDFFLIFLIAIARQMPRSFRTYDS